MVQLTLSLDSWTPHSALITSTRTCQGHIEAARGVGSIYFWGQGVAADYPRAMAAYKVGAEGGDVMCQWQVGIMYHDGQGVDVDYEQALPWLQKAAAQDDPDAVGILGTMYGNGEGLAPSCRRAREHYERAIELGSPQAVKNMPSLAKDIQAVRSERSHHSAASRTPPPPTPFQPIPFPGHVQAAPLMDKRVEVHGTGRADMNGKCGIATDFHYYRANRTKDRYTVQLDSGEAFKVRPASVRAEGTGDGGGVGGAGAGKAKGKGKKGRGGRK